MAILQFRRGNTPSSPSELNSGELYLDLTQDKFLYKNVDGNKLYSISRSNVVNNLTQLNNISSLLLETGDIGVTTDDQKVYMRSGSNWYPLMYERLLNSEDISNNAITGDKILTGSISYENLNDDLKFTVDNINNNLKYGLDFDGSTEYLTRTIQIVSKTSWSSLTGFTTSNVVRDTVFYTNDLSRPYVATNDSLKFSASGYIGYTGLTIGKQYMCRLVYYMETGTALRIGITNSGSTIKNLTTISTNWQELEFNFIATSTDFYISYNGVANLWLQEWRIKEDTGLDLNDVEMISVRNNRKFQGATTDLTNNGNHAITTSTDSPFTAGGVTGKTQSGKIVASGAGDSTTNFISLPATSFNVSGSTDSRTKILSGYKYLITFLAKPVTNNTTINVNIGSKTGTALTLADNTKWYLYTYQFLATSSEVDAQLKIFLNQADTVYIDELSITKAYDMLINVWDRNVSTESILTIFSNGAAGALNHNGIRLYRDTANIFTIRTQSYEYSTAPNIPFITATTSNNKEKITQIILSYNNIKKYENNTTFTASAFPLQCINNFFGDIYISQVFNNINRYLGLIGQIQFVRFNNADSFNPLDIDGVGTSIYEYSQTHKGYPSTYTGGEIVFWFDWVGDTDTEMLTDLSGRGNNLTGVNVTLLDNRRRYILE